MTTRITFSLIADLAISISNGIISYDLSVLGESSVVHIPENLAIHLPIDGASNLRFKGQQP